MGPGLEESLLDREDLKARGEKFPARGQNLRARQKQTTRLGAKRRIELAPTVRSGYASPKNNGGPKGRNDHSGPSDLYYLLT